MWGIYGNFCFFWGFGFLRLYLNFCGVWGAKFGGFCHFERSEKSIRILKYTLNLWILRYAQYDK